ncbi:sugar phosphate isomerase/epimerase [Bartonella sp. HY329]|uniref:sugar phosphate isomerase/epimerase family protein n=1 Tax=unclassified Bartonella TaxID=2645622 RepID=UPI0021C74DEA|nr:MULTISPECIES: sugar phosphate isomerase/epimerase [unclassified Bartonella]UXM95181.1 sugar phosphate isomerase/epimerase [Bartonella sp. HY329]UXN09504.1 sugar phosphate isomerase/epimerase [Bartonella sp. HY328]
MKLGITTEGLAHLSLVDALNTIAELGLEYVEFGLGGWNTAPHAKLKTLLADAKERNYFLGLIKERNLKISALNCSGNPLHPGDIGMQDTQLTKDTIALAKLMGVNRIVMMSGLPAGNATDTCPNWITTSWPLEAVEMANWQWKERLIPFWQEHAKLAEENGIKICIENHGRQCVYNIETYMRLRDVIGPTIGINFDPSHLIWMGGDPVSAIKALGSEHIYHVHGKDTRIEPAAKINGTLDDKPVTPIEKRFWNYVPVGHGISKRGWRDIVQALRDSGYDDVISIENEDYTLDSLQAIRDGVDTLSFAIKYSKQQAA